MVNLSYLLSAKYMNHIHTITFKIIKNFINYIGHEKRITTWESCRDVVEMDHDIKQLEQCKHGREKYTP